MMNLITDPISASRRIKTLFFLACFLFAGFSSLQGDQVVITLKGHLGKEEIAKADAILKEASNGEPQRLIIEVNSTSGNLKDVLEFVKSIYALKAEKRAAVIVYIQENAIGPAAVIPFLADELYISFFVSWGDIPLGSEEILPTNILRNSVRSIISPDHANRPLLNLMAAAMTDPSLQIVDDGGWKIKTGDDFPVISAAGEALVVNHNQLKELGLISGTMSPSSFHSKFELADSKEEETAEPSLAVSQKDFDLELGEHLKFDAKGPNSIGLIQITNKKEAISQSTWIYVKNALDYYKENPPKMIILELNTPGGEVFSAQKISDALKEFDTQYDIPIVAFINNWAISAGAMLAYSCRFITLSKDASMGAAEPVNIGEGGQMVTASEKVNSALRADFANRARFFDRNPDIAEAMVDKDIILVERYGKIIRLNSEDQIRASVANPDVIISAKGKLLTLNAEEMIEYGVADLVIPPEKLQLITAAEKEKGKWPASKMLLFQYSFFQGIPGAEIDLYQMDWKTKLLALLSMPVVSSLLFLGMLLGFYVEINSPGFGFPGSIALLCLFLIILSSFALEAADFLEIILLLVGVVFIALDLFLIPTFGILGVIGVVFFFIGLFGIMLPGIGSIDFELDTQTFNAAGQVFVRRLAWLCGTLVVGVLLIALMGRYVMPSFSGFRRFTLVGHEETSNEGYFAGIDPKTLPQPGSEGEVMATLRPSGKVLIKDGVYDAITFGEILERGTPIVVVSREGSVLVVEKDLKKR
jgi:membrane-bound ClpP family serine protease